MPAKLRSRCHILAVLAVIFLPFATATPASAEIWGELTGTVTDSSGSPVAFALVTATRADTGVTLPAVAGTDGNYWLRLAPGEYSIAFESHGYQTVEIPGTRVDVLRPTVRNCRLEETDQSSAGAEATTQNQQPTPSGKEQEPSLEDLGISPEQSKGNAKEQALLNKRTHMLKIHQKMGLITIGPFATTLIFGAFAGGKQPSSTDRDVHAILGAVTTDLYFTTAYFAIRAPKIPGTKRYGPIRLHKAMAWIHAPGMVLTPILGEIAFDQKSKGEKVHGIASAHGAVAIVTAGAFGIAVASVSIKF